MFLELTKPTDTNRGKTTITPFAKVGLFCTEKIQKEKIMSLAVAFFFSLISSWAQISTTLFHLCPRAGQLLMLW